VTELTASEQLQRQSSQRFLYVRFRQPVKSQCPVHHAGGDERCGRPELRLHVQVAHHRQQQRRQDVVPLPLLRRLFLVVVRQHRWHRLQSKDRIPAGQAHQTTDLGI